MTIAHLSAAGLDPGGALFAEKINQIIDAVNASSGNLGTTVTGNATTQTVTLESAGTTNNSINVVVTGSGTVSITGIPTADPHVAGALYVGNLSGNHTVLQSQG